MIQITFCRGARRVAVEGHARFAAPGQDIVCAGVSALTQALIDASADYNGAVQEKPNGDIFVQCSPDPGREAECDAMLRAILLGYRSIASDYPGFVSMGNRK